jgi:hypothetical protein
MKTILVVGLGLLLVLVGSYFILPETLFDLAVTAGRYSAGLTKKEIQVDSHRIVYLEGKGKRYCCSMVLPLTRITGYDLQSTSQMTTMW